MVMSWHVPHLPNEGEKKISKTSVMLGQKNLISERVVLSGRLIFWRWYKEFLEIIENCIIAV